AVRWKLERMGGGSSDAEGVGSRLIRPALRGRGDRSAKLSGGGGEDHARDLLELAADLVDQSVARFGVRFAAVLPLVEQDLDAGRGRADQPRRAVVEPAAF